MDAAIAKTHVKIYDVSPEKNIVYFVERDIYQCFMIAVPFFKEISEDYSR